MKIFTYLLTASLLSTAHAQTASTPPKTADERAATYQGPKVVKDSKILGKKMVQKSKPADGVRTSVRELPVKSSSTPAPK